MNGSMLEELITIHGEKYRRLIIDALMWLQTAEKDWNLTKPIDKTVFISNLVKEAS